MTLARPARVSHRRLNTLEYPRPVEERVGNAPARAIEILDDIREEQAAGSCGDEATLAVYRHHDGGVRPAHHGVLRSKMLEGVATLMSTPTASYNGPRP